MKAYFVALAAGALVGLIYSVMNVKSPAPPTIALVGLPGMLVGTRRRQSRRVISFRSASMFGSFHE